MLGSVLLWAHFVSLAVGGAATFGLPVVGAAMPNVAPDARPVMTGVLRSLSLLGRGAMTVLILTGGLLVWLGPGLGGLGLWFWIKMALVVLLIVGIVIATRQGAAAQRGDATAAARAAMMGKVNMLLLAGVLFSAVLAFG